MTVREFLRANMAVIDDIYLTHEGGVRDDICYCHCGYRSTEPEWLLHVADKIADALAVADVELPLFEAV